MHPSHALYQSLQTAYEHFNRELFEAQLPEVIFTVQRQKEVMGYFAPERWVSPAGERCHEIAINPTHMGQSRVIEVLQTLAHEMVHCWQHCFGKPGRSCYHNKEWAEKMQSIGLHPSSTGEPGGAITGQHMSDYPDEAGGFLQACQSLVIQHAFRLPWIYRVASPKGMVFEPPMPNDPIGDPSLEIEVTNTRDSHIESLSPDTFLHNTYHDVLPAGSFYVPAGYGKKNKVKYQCTACFSAVWGKPGIQLICGDCRVNYEELG